MSKSYEIKPSTQCGGLGVFATKAIAANTVILKDTNIAHYSSTMCISCFNLHPNPSTIQSCSRCKQHFCSPACMKRDTIHGDFCEALGLATRTNKSELTLEAIVTLLRFQKNKPLQTTHFQSVLSLQSRLYTSAELKAHQAIWSKLPSSVRDWCSADQFSTMLGAIANNAFTTLEGTSLLLPIISRVNHACAPNALNTDGVISALNDITIGEEICISYKALVLAPLLCRRYMTTSSWQFKCSCRVCVKGALRLWYEGIFFGAVCQGDKCQDHPIAQYTMQLKRAIDAYSYPESVSDGTADNTAATSAFASPHKLLSNLLPPVIKTVSLIHFLFCTSNAQTLSSPPATFLAKLPPGYRQWAKDAWADYCSIRDDTQYPPFIAPTLAMPSSPIACFRCGTQDVPVKTSPHTQQPHAHTHPSTGAGERQTQSDNQNKTKSQPQSDPIAPEPSTAELSSKPTDPNQPTPEPSLIASNHNHNRNHNDPNLFTDFLYWPNPLRAESAFEVCYKSDGEEGKDVLVKGQMLLQHLLVSGPLSYPLFKPSLTPTAFQYFERELSPKPRNIPTLPQHSDFAAQSALQATFRKQIQIPAHLADLTHRDHWKDFTPAISTVDMREFFALYHLPDIDLKRPVPPHSPVASPLGISLNHLPLQNFTPCSPPLVTMYSGLLTIALHADKFVDALVFMLLLTPFCSLWLHNTPHDYYKMMVRVYMALNHLQNQQSTAVVSTQYYTSTVQPLFSFLKSCIIPPRHFQAHSLPLMNMWTKSILDKNQQYYKSLRVKMLHQEGVKVPATASSSLSPQNEQEFDAFVGLNLFFYRLPYAIVSCQHPQRILHLYEDVHF